jgi:peptidoglycan hydrolase-like amidase
MGLFHSSQLTVESIASRPLLLRAKGQQLAFGVDAPQSIRIQREERTLVVEGERGRFKAAGLQFTARQGGDSCFILSMPGKLRRRYCGKLRITASGRELLPVVEMELETAVASIVAAELPAGTPLEALKAQAVVARSYLVAGKHRHAAAEFCDTTHCQFLREPPPSSSAAGRASLATRGLVLKWQGAAFAAMYSASCGGRTHTAAEAGLPPAEYPYFPVECPYCRRDAPGRGHGVGLCQSGAAAMARQGQEYREILSHYFPNTTIGSLSLAGEP